MITTRKEWNEGEVIMLQSMWEQGYTVPQIARKFGRSQESIKRKVVRMEVNGQLDHKRTTRNREPLSLKRYTDHLKLSGDIITISDVHVPFWHRGLFDKMYGVAKKFKISTLGINGDFLNLDSFSHWITGFRGIEATEQEFESASYVLLKALEVFDKIYITQGNHEDRLLKILEGQVTARRFFRMLSDQIGKRIIVSDYPFFDVGENCRVIHPKQYSMAGGKTPAKIADKVGKHIISGHNHHWGIQFSLNGKWMGVDQGMGGDPEMIEYHAMSVTANPEWQNGFTMIKDTFLYPFNLNTSDWKYWLGKR